MLKTVICDDGKKGPKHPEICFLSDSGKKSLIENSGLQTCLKIGSIRRVCDYVNNTEFGRIVLYFFSTNFEEWW